MNFLEKLGVYGLDSIEYAVIAGLITGDPVLMVGAHGSAKTLLAQRLAWAMDLKFHAYDASKALFEDVIGFPNPRSISKGKIDYIPTEISMWDKEFVLVDELSRASPMMQNKWLEVIRSRRVMGKSARKLRYVFAAMNPPGYIGSIPLDAALAGRFAYIINIPNTDSMDSRDLGRIIEEISEDDAPEITFSRFHPDPAVQKELQDFVRRARNRINRIIPVYQEELKEYVSNLSLVMKMEGKYLDGRRLGMIWRGIFAFLGIEQEKAKREKKLPPGEVEQCIFRRLQSALPFEAAGESFRPDVLYSVHLQTLHRIKHESQRTAALQEIFRFREPHLVAQNYRKYARELSSLDHEEVVTFFEERMKDKSRKAGETVSLYDSLVLIVEAVMSRAVRLDPVTARKLLMMYLQMLGEDPFSEDRDNRTEALHELLGQKEGEARKLMSTVALDRHPDALAMRLAYGGCGEKIEEENLMEYFKQFRQALYEAQKRNHGVDPETKGKSQ